MGLQKDEALVLTKISYGESDKIVRLFTLMNGKVSAIAKGGSKSQKRFMNTLEPFNHIRIEYFKKQNKSLARIENADLIESNKGIEKSLKSFCAASFFAEFTDRLTKDGERNKDLFDVLKYIFINAKDTAFGSSEIVINLLNILKVTGFLPNFKSCVYCGREVPDEEKVYFSKERGGILCKICSSSLSYKTYPAGVIISLSLFEKKGNFLIDPKFIEYIQAIMEDFIAFHLDVKLKSYRLLKSVIKEEVSSINP
ncbi:MAG TPA: DNA repair protein RecO [Syntrophorhabdaceae bacterium]|nr:DNA repair protein RecO [Syntrophorhabdaceae bacterium]HPU30511.1 DNA repair protein RecO [Syntrophorhabdaceae bacterium]